MSPALSRPRFLLVKRTRRPPARVSKINDLQVRQSDLASATIARFSEAVAGTTSDQIASRSQFSERRVHLSLARLWRAVDHEGEVLEAVVTARRQDKAAALKLLQEDHDEVGPTAEDRYRQASGLLRGNERD